MKVNFVIVSKYTHNFSNSRQIIKQIIDCKLIVNVSMLIYFLKK